MQTHAHLCSTMRHHFLSKLDDRLRVFRFIALLVLLGAATACAATGSGGERKAANEGLLPRDLLGTWVPYSEGYQQFGDLSITSDTLAWGGCSSMSYSVLRSSGAVYFVEIALESCQITGDASFLILELSTQGLEVSICRDPAEFDKRRPYRRCSWGVLLRKRDG
jgi:hypothetical protein